jgi:tetratricopeptide (TPR) repeat protein
MKFWRNAAALLIVFHPKRTHTGNHSTPKDVKNEGRPGKVYENKGSRGKMSETISDICARLKPFLQKIGLSSSPEDAFHLADRALHLKPNISEALTIRGRAALALRKPADAVEDFRKASKLDPGDATNHFQLARAYRQLGLTAQAEDETAIYVRMQGEAHSPKEDQQAAPQ